MSLFYDEGRSHCLYLNFSTSFKNGIGLLRMGREVFGVSLALVLITEGVGCERTSRSRSVGVSMASRTTLPWQQMTLMTQSFLRIL